MIPSAEVHTTATGPGSGPQGIYSAFFTFPLGSSGDFLPEIPSWGAVLDTFDGDPPSFILDLPALTVN